MRILVTGVAGQVGSHVAEKLLEIGHKVVGIDNFATGRPEHLPMSEDFSFFEGSIADTELVRHLFETESPEAIVHAAASYQDPDDWMEDAKTNALGGVNLVQESVSRGIKRFIYFQTALIYGTAPSQSPITLTHPKDVANSSYAISKSVCEDYLEISGLSYVVFRLANVVGERCLSGPIPTFYQRLVDGKQCFITPARRDFVYVKDLVKTVVVALEGSGQGSYHFSSGHDTAISELYDMVVTELGLEKKSSPELRDLNVDEAATILLDPSRTVRDFGDIEFTPLSIIIRNSLEYYKKFGTRGEITHLRQQGS